jgi:hypothetical protein
MIEKKIAKSSSETKNIPRHYGSYLRKFISILIVYIVSKLLSDRIEIKLNPSKIC